MANEESTLFGITSLITILALFMYSIGGAFLEAKKFHLIHETGLGIMLGVFGGFLVSFYGDNAINKLSDFNNQLFFYVLLPVIIFSGGYNLNKKRFFQNFMYINLFGLFGTIICFFFIVLCTWWVNELKLIRQWNKLDQSITLNLYQIMIFSATICATDSVAGLTMIKPDKHPKLFSVVFGEGMVNDAVAIIIFLAVGDLAKADGSLDYDWFTSFQLLGLFLRDLIASLLIGVLVGLFTAWLFKTFRFLTHSCILETSIILYMGYASFAICELTHLSGVISVLVTGIILAHYNFYNISPIGKISSQVTLSTLSFVCEAAIYIYLGLSVWTLKATTTKPEKTWSWTFACCELLITMLARAISMLAVAGLVILIKGRNSWRLSIWEMNIIWYAGLIRGSIAYALIQQLRPGTTDIAEIELLKNTVLVMVLITTIFYGGLMPLVINLNMKFQQRDENAINPRNTIGETLLGQIETKGESEQSKRFRGQIQKLVKRLDDKFVKPFFIHDFVVRQTEIERSKKMLKMNNQEFDPNNIGRLTIQLGQQNMHNSGSIKDAIQKRKTLDQMNGNGQEQKQAIMTKITLSSSSNSKFMGKQQLSFDMDVPMIVSEDQDNFDEEGEEDQLANRSSLLSESEVPKVFNEITMSQMIPK